MSHRCGRLIFLTGAPDSKFLDWNETGLLSTATYMYHMKKYLADGGTSADAEIPKLPGDIYQLSWLEQPTELQIAWRRLPLQPEHLPTGLSQETQWQTSSADAPTCSEETTQRIPVDQEASFLTSSDLSVALPTNENHTTAGTVQSGDGSFGSTDDELLSQFYEHFLAVHQDLASSQIVSEQTDSNGRMASDSNATSRVERASGTINDTSLQFSESSSLVQSPIPKPVIGRVMDLADIPSASYLESIIPQTMTVNLIVGVIDIGTDRVVRIRRTGQEMCIVELLVGDETKAGFAINLWLPPPAQQKTPAGKKHPEEDGDHDLVSTLCTLRPHDVILARNVALSSFHGRVFGQSLRKGVTRLQLLHRRQPLASQVGLRKNYGVYHPSELASMTDDDPYPSKVRCVRDWLLEFVEPRVSTSTTPSRSSLTQTTHTRQLPKEAQKVLPPDTP